MKWSREWQGSCSMASAAQALFSTADAEYSSAFFSGIASTLRSHFSLAIHMGDFEFFANVPVCMVKMALLTCRRAGLQAERRFAEGALGEDSMRPELLSESIGI